MQGLLQSTYEESEGPWARLASLFFAFQAKSVPEKGDGPTVLVRYFLRLAFHHQHRLN